MNKIKVNLDRKGISSEEILKKMNFDELLLHQNVLSKPFYKTKWFYGVTGLATVSLIVGSAYNLNMEGDNMIPKNVTLSSIPIQLKNKNLTVQKEVEPEVKKNVVQIIKQNQIIEKTITLDKVENKKDAIKDEISPIINSKKEEKKVETKKVFNMLDLYPRIAGKLNGSITKEQLFNDEGLKTNTNIEIISFELHLVDGVGGKVYTNEGNRLNLEMKTALNKVSAGGEIYFEEINGKATTGETFRLSPLRYVLLN